MMGKTAFTQTFSTREKELAATYPLVPSVHIYGGQYGEGALAICASRGGRIQIRWSLPIQLGSPAPGALSISIRQSRSHSRQCFAESLVSRLAWNGRRGLACSISDGR